jgi:hypothetical protein
VSDETLTRILAGNQQGPNGRQHWATPETIVRIENVILELARERLAAECEASDGAR